MSDTVDTRVVEAKFDAEDFEKGVDKTLAKLDELKKSLNMKDTGKSVTEFSKITSEATEKANSSLEKLTDRLTTFTGQLKNQLISGLASEVSNTFLSMERSITGFFRTITSGSISSGMNRYTEILTSVRTMVAAGKDQTEAYDAIKKLGEYADQTSYSLSQMAGTMSKMVAAGAGVEEARKSVEGLANMAAAAGVNIYDANRAFLNFSQAYSSGKMEIRDWLSFESLNMSTEKTMKLFMEAGVMAGTLTKTVKKNADNTTTEVYKTVNKVNKKIQNGKQVAIKGFRDTLKYGWLDQSTMQAATGLLSFYDEYGGDIEKLTEDQLAQAKAMYGAAKEARSFADVMGTLKDVLSTGWGNTFEKIFGELDRATEFFTKLSESNILDIFYSLSSYRNDILDAWNSKISKDGLNGSEMFLDALLKIDEAVGKVKAHFEELAPEADNVGLWLFQRTNDFRTATENLNKWLEETTSDGKTRSRKIAEVLNVVSTAFAIVGKTIGTVISGITTVLNTFSPVFDAVLDVFDRFALSLDTTFKSTKAFDDFNNAVKNLTIIADPLVKALAPVIEVLGYIGQFFLESSIATMTMNIELLSDSLGFLIELFGGKSAQKLKNPNGGVLDNIKNSITEMKNAMDAAFSTVKVFFSALFEDIKKLFGIGEIAEGEEGGFFKNVSDFFKTNTFVADAKAWIDHAIIDVGNFIKSIPSRLSGYAINVWDFFNGLFYQPEDLSGMTGNGHGAVSAEITDAKVATPLKQWLDGAIEKVKEFIATIPTRLADAAKTVGTVVGKTIESVIAFFIGDKTAEFELNKVDANGNIDTQTVIVRDTLNSGFNQMINAATSFIKDIPNKVKKAVKNIGTILENFWDGLFYTNTKVVDIDKDGKKYWKNVKIKKPLKKFVDSIVKDAIDFIKKIPTYVRDGIRGTGDIIGTLISSLFGKKDGKEVTGKDIEDAAIKPFANFSLSGLYGKIKEIATNVGNWVMSIFTGTDDLEENQTIFAETVANGITWIKEHAEKAWNTISEWFIDLPHKIADFFSGERTADEIKDKKDIGPIEKAVGDFAKSVGNFIEGIPDTLLTFVDNAVAEISKLWDKVYNALSGKGSEGKSQKELFNYGQGGYTGEAARLAEVLNDSAPDPERVKVSKWEMFTRHLGETISNLFATIPTMIAQGVDLAIQGIDWAISGITKWFDGKTVEATLADESKKAGETIVEEVGKDTEAGAEEGKGLLKALGNIGQSISNLITKTIPGFLSSGWDFVKNGAGGWWESFKSIFDGINTEDLHDKLTGIGTTIEGFIREIPTYIHKGIDWITGQLSKSKNNGGTVLAKSFDWDYKAIGSILQKDLNIVDQEVKTGIEKTSIWTTMKEAWDDQINRTQKGIQGPEKDYGFWGIIASIGESIKYAFSQLGPYIIEGINTAIEWVNKGLSWLTNFFTNRNKSNNIMDDLAVAVAGETGENKQFAESAEKLGETISDTLTDTIPKFVGEAAKEVAAQAPNILETLFSGLISSANAEEVASEMHTTAYENTAKAVLKVYEKSSEQISEAQKEINKQQEDLYKDRARKMMGEGIFPTDEETKDTENKAKNATTVLEVVKNIFNGAGKLMESDIGKTSVILISAAFLLSQIKDILSLTDEVESFGEPAKWEAVKIAIAGIVGFVAYIAAISQIQTEDQLNKTWENFEKIVGFVERIAGALAKLSVLKIGQTGLEALSDFFGMKEAKWGAKAAGAAATGKLGWLTNIGSSLLSTRGGTLAVLAGLEVGGTTLSNVTETFSSAVSDSLQLVAGGMTNFFETLIPGFNAIVEVSDKLSKAQGFVEEFKKFLQLLIDGFDLNTKDVQMQDEDSQHEFTKFLEGVDANIKMIFNLGQMLNLLGSSMNTMPDLDTAKEKCAEITQLFGTEEFKGLVNTASAIFKEHDPGKIEDTAMGMQTLGNVLTVFMGSLATLTPENVGVFERTLDCFDRIIAAYSGADWSRYGFENIWKGDKSLSNFGLQIEQFGGYMKHFFENVKKINIKGDSEIKMFNDRIDLIVKITQGFAKAAKDVYGTNGGEGLETMASRMTGMGSQIASFVNALSTGLNADITLDKLSVVAEATDIFKTLAETISTLYQVGADIPEATLTIGEMIRGIFGDPNNKETQSLIDQINSLVIDKIELKPTITPIIDMTNVDAAFNSRFGPNWQFNFDPGIVAAQAANPTNINGNSVINTQVDLSGISSKLEAANRYLALILEKNPNYSVFMDTGRLVGELGPSMYNYISARNFRQGRGG